jgi:two-component system, chemotaxis family, protein-glutamate methylesterase/glutaminase
MIRLIVVGASFGGLDAIRTLLLGLPRELPVPIVVTLHIGTHSISHFIRRLNNESQFDVREAEDKIFMENNTIYFAPPNYHLMVEKDFTLNLSADEKINFSRPSIDVLFETAAWALGPEVIGVLLTGANNDGAAGLKAIHDNGGIAIVQDPSTAVSGIMPQAALNLFKPDSILPVEYIGGKIYSLFGQVAGK